MSLCPRRAESGMPQCDGKRHDDHASKCEIEIHQLFILSLEWCRHSEQGTGGGKIRRGDSNDRNN
jgi:hypothetical protein